MLLGAARGRVWPLAPPKPCVVVSERSRCFGCRIGTPGLTSVVGLGVRSMHEGYDADGRHGHDGCCAPEGELHAVDERLLRLTLDHVTQPRGHRERRAGLFCYRLR